jgi:hypothetical protein
MVGMLKNERQDRMLHLLMSSGTHDGVATSFIARSTERRDYVRNRNPVTGLKKNGSRGGNRLTARSAWFSSHAINDEKSTYERYQPHYIETSGALDNLNKLFTPRAVADG